MDWSKTKKEKLLALLEDDDIQRRICEIVLSALQQEGKDVPILSIGEDAKELKYKLEELKIANADLVEENKKLLDEKKFVEKKLKDFSSNKYEDRLGEMQERVAFLQQKLTESENECKNVKKQARTYVDRLEKSLTANKVELENISNEKQCLEEQIEKLSKDNSELQKKVKEVEWLEAVSNQDKLQLEQGVSLYYKLQNLSTNVRNHLEIVIAEDNVLSFLGGLAQEEALGRLWDELYSCFENDQSQDVNVLRDVFQYAIIINNAVKGTTRYDYLPIEEGQSYDPDLMLVDRKGSIQGNVAQVLIPGYYNTYTRGIMRRSFVQLK